MSAADKTEKPKVTRTYKDAGVDIDAGNEVVRRIRGMAKTTFSSRVITDIGGFGGLFSLDTSRYKNPILVSSCDGVGSKLKVAFMTNRHDTIGIDLVAMSVNDIMAQGAQPLFFLDYLAMAKVDPDMAEAIMSGIAEGCRDSSCALIGGETAELPDFYEPGEYDLAGFVVGVVEKEKIIDGSEISTGDQLVALGSNGLHSNGFTLVRRLIFDDLGMKPEDSFLGHTVADELLRPTKIYVSTAHVLLRDFKIQGIAHITGGGVVENIPRILPKGCRAVVRKNAWEHPEVFEFLQRAGQIEELEMFRTFNMGIGMVFVVPADQSGEILERLHGMGEDAYLIGHVEERKPGEESFALI